MKYELIFIKCKEYSFTNDNGELIEGVTCHCFDKKTNSIVKVKTDTVIPAEFGDILEVEAEINGNYVNFNYVA